jgi:hypothetical protein
MSEAIRAKMEGRQVMTGDAAAALGAAGWTQAEHGLEPCGTCTASTVLRSPDGVPRHRACWDFEAGAPRPAPKDVLAHLKARAARGRDE